MCTDTNIDHQVNVVARIAPKVRWLYVCGLDENGHRISLPGDELSKHSLFFQTMSVKPCGIRSTPTAAYAFRTMVPGHIPSRCRVSGHISSRRQELKHVAFGR